MAVTWNGQKVTAGVRKAIMRGLLTVAGEVRNDAIDSIMDGEKTGRIYTRRGVEHQASAPGEPPASDIGNLANSITLEPELARLAVVVRAGADYAAALEYGTQKMEPRPFMRPALAKNLHRLETVIAREVQFFMNR